MAKWAGSSQNEHNIAKNFCGGTAKHVHVHIHVHVHVHAYSHDNVRV